MDQTTKILKEYKYLLLIVALGLTLRFLYFFEGLTFGYDQARDALVALKIFESDYIKLVGPTTSIPGLRHGPLYWYLITPFYVLGNSSPWLARAILILLNVLSIIVIFDLSRLLFKSKSVGYISAFIFAVSFEMIQYARWMSNPAPVVLTSLLSYWALWKVISGKEKYLPLVFLFWGLSVQFQFFMVYQIVIFTIIWLILSKKKIPSLKSLIISGLIVIFSFSWLIASEVKFAFQGSKAFASFIPSQFTGSSSSHEMLLKTSTGITYLFSRNISGEVQIISILATLFIFSSVLYFIYKEINRKPLLFILIWMLSPLVLLPFSRRSGTDLYVGIGVGVIIASAYVLHKINSKNKIIAYVLIGLITFTNLFTIVKYNKIGEDMLTAQPGMVISDLRDAVDYTYNASNNKPFSINTITNPLFTNTTWAYLYYWYGRSNYGYLPTWWGDPQESHVGGEVPFESDIYSDVHYLIVENNLDSLRHYYKIIKILEDERSELVETKEFGAIVVEKRKITHPQSLFSSDVFEYEKELNAQ